MSTVKWGIIGCGDVTEQKSGPAFNKVDSSELVAVMRRTESLVKDYAKRHHVPRWYTSAKDLINDPEVTAVYVATPPDSHASYAIEAMEAGKPVYVEKPMALNAQETEAMIKASEKTGSKLYVAYYRRALPGFLKVKELLDSGAIGELRTVNLQLYKSISPLEQSEEKPWRVIPEIAGGGHFVDLASHQLDYLDYILGPVQEVRSLVENQAELYSAEDIISASFLFPGKVLASGSWCFSVPDFLQKDVIELIGTEGRINFSCFEFVPVRLETMEGIQSFDFPRPEHVQQNLIDLVVKDILGAPSSPSDGYSAARTTRIMDLVLENFYKK